MVRVRKLVLAIAAASALTSGTAYALGLGEIDLQSSLSQPLVAEIELLDARDLGTTEVIPALASPEDFNRAGVDRQYFLTDLKFTPVIRANGKSVIRITSTKPVREPYVNFLVEVLWPNGRLLREYTLLLDPPMYAPTPVVNTAPRLPVAVAPTPTARPQSAAPSPRPVAAAPSAPSRSSAPAVAVKADGDQYRTTSSDTLWGIAQRNRQSGTVHQSMMAIFELNPEAFANGNINRLKSGQVLRMPTDAQIRSRSHAEAVAQVAEQNNAWREGRAAAPVSTRQLDATRRDSAGAAPATAQARDSLKLVAADAGKSTAGSDQVEALNEQLAVTKESLDSSRRESEELKGRMTELQSQLEKAQRLLELKDGQLAKLQGDLAQQDKTVAVPAESESVAAPAEAAVAQPEAPVATESPAAPPQVAPVAEVAPAQVDTAAAAPAEAAAEAGASIDFNYEEGAPKPAAPVAQAPAAEPVQPVQATKPVAPVVQQAPAPKSLFDQVLENPTLLGTVGGGSLLILLIGLMMLSRRNAMKEAELQHSLNAGTASRVPDREEQLPDSSFADLDDLDETQQRDTQERAAPSAVDALGEADINIAYGKFTQAAEVLCNAINDEPQRSDLRLKLMEVYAELGDREGFARQEQELREIGGSAAAIDQLKARYPAMVLAAAAAAGAGAVAASETLDDFGLDDLDLDDTLAPQAAPVKDLDDAYDLDLDGDLDEPAAAAAAADLDDLGLSDLELDAPAAPAEVASTVDFDLDLAADGAAESLSLEDELADFGLDLNADAKPEATSEDDFMLSLDDESLTSAAASAEAGLDLPADFDLSLAEETPAAADSFAAQLEEVSAELEQLGGALADELPAALPEASVAVAGEDGEDDFDFLSGTDETATKLDLARAYIDMGDSEGARDILEEVVAEGNEGQKQEARELIATLS
ncbi:MAG: peptigoglycan-binding protein LysM [Pseudomonas sp.]|nr:MAG: peptigoglycan-binding protein LysM [Pseudomonas sp.]